ncbi:MAG: response regulator transcription factor, partial [Gemmatimonadota bacterium]|nr:response regulator transcription factor [Gemmatimonadota bacterium]
MTAERRPRLGRVRALICEDEPLAVRALREYLRDVDWIEVVGEAREGGEAMRLIHKLEPDLVFMDVRMPRLTGVEVLETVTHRPAVVFTTAHDEHAVKAFELGAVDYLVKPFGRSRLLACLDRVRVRLVGELRATTPPGDGPPASSAEPVDRLFARMREAIVPVPVSDIVRIDAEDGGGLAVTAEGEFALSMTLGELEDRL